MTIKKTLAKLKELGCKARWSSDWQEYRVTLPNLSNSREEAIAYYTSDPFDAVLTGAEMVRTARAQGPLNVLERIVAFSSAPVPDSTGHNVVKVREALIDEARATIAKAKEETCPKAAAQERIGNIWDAQDKQEAY